MAKRNHHEHNPLHTPNAKIQIDYGSAHHSERHSFHRESTCNSHGSSAALVLFLSTMEPGKLHHLHRSLTLLPGTELRRPQNWWLFFQAQGHTPHALL